MFADPLVAGARPDEQAQRHGDRRAVQGGEVVLRGVTGAGWATSGGRLGWKSTGEPSSSTTGATSERATLVGHSTAKGVPGPGGVVA